MGTNKNYMGADKYLESLDKRLETKNIEIKLNDNDVFILDKMVKHYYDHLTDNLKELLDLYPDAKDMQQIKWKRQLEIEKLNRLVVKFQEKNIHI